MGVLRQGALDEFQLALQVAPPEPQRRQQVLPSTIRVIAQLVDCEEIRCETHVQIQVVNQLVG